MGANGEYAGPLREVIEKGQYEMSLKVCGDDVLMHIAKVKEEQAINVSVADVPLLDRDYERWIQRLSHTVTRISSHVFPTQPEALAFFKELSQPHVEEYVSAYTKLVEGTRKKLGLELQEVKNS